MIIQFHFSVNLEQTIATFIIHAAAFVKLFCNHIYTFTIFKVNFVFGISETIIIYAFFAALNNNAVLL